MLILQNSAEKQISGEELLTKIEEKGWWQGTVISKDTLLDECDCQCSEFWVIISQSCNLYNPCFDNVSVFEVVAACRVPVCDPSKSSGDNPRILHVEAVSKTGEIIMLELDIQTRRWLQRRLLGTIEKPNFQVLDSKKRWLDNLIGWIARSYTRISLPNEFNNTIRDSKIGDLLKKFFKKYHDEIYGIYLFVEYGGEDKSTVDVIGKMPPPYDLGIILITEEHADPDNLKNELIQKIFTDKIGDKDTTRAELARNGGIRLIDEGIEAKSIAETSLLELKPLVRYTFFDHFSDSSMATEP